MPDANTGQLTDTPSLEWLTSFDLFTVQLIHSITDPVELLRTIVAGLLVVALGALLAWLGKRVWNSLRHLALRGITRIATIRGFRRFAVSAYLAQVRQRFGQVINIYLNREDELDLHQVFVPLTLVNRASGYELETSRDSRAVLTDPNQKRLLILGAPGSGKTTLMKALASGVSRHQWVEYRDLIPLLIRLREYAAACQTHSLHEWLSTHLDQHYGLRAATSLLDALLTESRLLLLLDGLDEVNEEVQHLISERIREFQKSWDAEGRNRIMITCREQNYDLLPDPTAYLRMDFTVYRLADLRDAEMEALVARRQQDFAAKGKHTENFLAAIRTLPRINRLHRNPLLLTLSIGLYLNRPDDAVPSNIAEFYQESIDNLLRRHDFRGQGGLDRKNRFDTRDKRALLERFALARMENVKGDFETFPLRELTAEAERLAGDRLSVSPDQAEALVAEIQSGAGLIGAQGNDDTYAFAHRSLHEYCAAARLRQIGSAGLKRLVERLAQAQWSQTIVFYCSMEHDDAEKLVQKMLERSETDSDPLPLLILAGQSAAVLSAPLAELRLTVVKRLRQALENTTDEEQRRNLLITLIALGRDAPTPVQEEVDTQLRRQFALNDPKTLAREIGRLDPATAIALLELMADSEEPERRRAALVGASALEGNKRIPLLWRLLADFLASNDRDGAACACQACLASLEQKGGVERLNNQADRLIRFIDDTEAKQAYPFQLEGEKPNNLARLLGVVANLPKDKKVLPERIGETYKEFLKTVLSKKDKNEQEWWKRLYRDRQRKALRLHMQRWGRLFVGVSWGTGLLLVATLLLDIINFSEIEDKIATLLVISAFVALGLLAWGAILSLVWPFWYMLARRMKWVSRDAGVTAGLKIWGAFTPYRTTRPSSFKDMIELSWTIFTRRTKVLGYSAGLFLLALAAPNPSLDGHAQAINGVSFSPAGHLILTGSLDDTFILWDAINGTELRRFKGHNNNVNSITFSPDGQQILSGSNDYSARVWDPDKGTEIRRFTGHEDNVNSAIFSPDGGQVLTGSSDNTARIWDAVNATELQRFTGHEDKVNSVAFSPDGQQILTGSDDGTSRIWDAANGTELLRFTGHEDNVNSVAFSSDGQQILTGSDDGTTRIWDAVSGAELKLFKLPETKVKAVAFSQDDKQILTGSEDDIARLWDRTKGTVIRRFEGHTKNVNAVAFSPDGRKILTGSNDDSARLWDTVNSTQIWVTPRRFLSFETWNHWNWVIFTAAIILTVFLPTTRLFDPDRYFYLRRPNPYIWLYDLPGIDSWLPPERIDHDN